MKSLLLSWNKNMGTAYAYLNKKLRALTLKPKYIIYLNIKLKIHFFWMQSLHHWSRFVWLFSPMLYTKFPRKCNILVENVHCKPFPVWTYYLRQAKLWNSKKKNTNLKNYINNSFLKVKICFKLRTRHQTKVSSCCPTIFLSTSYWSFRMLENI